MIIVYVCPNPAKQAEIKERFHKAFKVKNIQSTKIMEIINCFCTFSPFRVSRIKL